MNINIERVINLLNTSKFDLRPLQWLRLVAHAIWLTWIHIWKANLQRLRISFLVKMSVARMLTSPTLILWTVRLPICGLFFLRYFCSWDCLETFWTCSFCEECVLRRTPHWFYYFFSVLRTWQFFLSGCLATGRRTRYSLISGPFPSSAAKSACFWFTFLCSCRHGYSWWCL